MIRRRVDVKAKFVGEVVSGLPSKFIGVVAIEPITVELFDAIRLRYTRSRQFHRVRGVF